MKIEALLTADDLEQYTREVSLGLQSALERGCRAALHTALCSMHDDMKPREAELSFAVEGVLSDYAYLRFHIWDHTNEHLKALCDRFLSALASLPELVEEEDDDDEDDLDEYEELYHSYRTRYMETQTKLLSAQRENESLTAFLAKSQHDIEQVIAMTNQPDVKELLNQWLEVSKQVQHDNNEQ